MYPLALLNPSPSWMKMSLILCLSNRPTMGCVVMQRLYGFATSLGLALLFGFMVIYLGPPFTVSFKVPHILHLA